MRLIDADKLLQEIWKVETKDMFHMTEIVDVISAIDIKNAPTVEAIPIKWIENYTRKNFPLEKGEIVLGFMADMLDDWRKENL